MLCVKWCIVCILATILFFQCSAKGENFINTIKQFVSEYMDNNTMTITNLDTIARNLKNEILKMKFILLWYGNSDVPEIFKEMGQARKIFIDKLCPEINCFVTTNKRLFRSEADFDVVIFYGPQTVDGYIALPEARSPHQKYIFMSNESSDNYPVCKMNFTNYFNWTWTYKLNSDEYYGYIIIRNQEGEIVGPKEVMHWKNLKDMEPVHKHLKNKLKNKIFAAAAFFSTKCEPLSGRHIYLNLILNELHAVGLTLDVFGPCGTKKCPGPSDEDCWGVIQRDYFFYMAFEDSLSEDYVTDQLLNALKHYTVPVVFGAANYSRFMPPGIYLNALALGPKGLVQVMVNFMSDKEKYYNLFKWHNHYSYHSITELPETEPVCRLCSKINNIEEMNKITIVRNFTRWWMSHTFRKNVCEKNLNDLYF